MVQYCFNPACRQEFQLLHAGDLYALEWESADTEFFWLCADCASRFDLYLDDSGVVALSSRGAGRMSHRPSTAGELHLISRCARPAPRLDSRPTAERHYSLFHGTEPHFSGYRARVTAWEEEDVPAKHLPRSAA